MNKRQILAALNNIANQLDNTGLIKESDSVTNIMTRLADEFNIETPADERENKRQRIITQALNTTVRKDNLDSTLYYYVPDEPRLTIKQIADALIERVNLNANELIDLLNRGKMTPELMVKNSLITMNRFKEKLYDLLKMYAVPSAPVFYYLNQGHAPIIEKINNKIKEYEEYHDSDLFRDDVKEST
jgi:hypothetical protein